MRPSSVHAGINVALAAVSVAVLLVMLFAYATGGDPPLNGLAEEIMARTPALIADRLLDVLGPIARPMAVLGAMSFVLVVAGIAGAMTAASSRWGLVVSGITWVAGIAVLAELGLTAPITILLLITICYFVILRATRRIADLPGRRGLLRYAAVGTAGVMVTANTAFFVALARQLTIGKEGGRRLFAWTNPGAADARFAAAPSPFVQEVSDFYVMSKNVEDPRIVEERWKLTVSPDGSGEPRRFTLDDLQAMPRVDLWCTMRCVSNAHDSRRWMSTALFSGVDLAGFLERAGIQKGAESGLNFRGTDGHEESHSFAELMSGPAPAIVVYALNGRELSQAHGFPARVLVPGQYGFRSVKWLTEIRRVSGPRDGTWERRGWDADAIHTCSFCDGVVVSGGERYAFGVAYSPDGIEKVEARIDGGDWRTAEISQPLSAATWVAWRLPIAVARGRLTVRATDGNGVSQIETETDPHPDGATGLQTITFG